MIPLVNLGNKNSMSMVLINRLTESLCNIRRFYGCKMDRIYIKICELFHFCPEHISFVLARIAPSRRFSSTHNL